MKKKTKKALFILVSILLILFIGYQVFKDYEIVFSMLLKPAYNKELLLRAVRSHGVETALLLIGLTVAMSLVPGMPTSVVGIFTGIAYGPFFGSIINIIANASGNFMSILMFQKLNISGDSIQVNKWTRFLTKVKYPRFQMMILYMIPFVPVSLINLAVHSFQFEWSEVYWVIIIGVVPTSVLYALGGQVFFQGQHLSAAAIFSTAAVIGILLFLFMRHKKKKIEVE